MRASGDAFKGYFRADKKEYEMDIRHALSSTGTLIEKSTNAIHKKAAPEKRVDRRKRFKDQVRERRAKKKESLKDTGETHLGQPSQGWIKGMTSSVCTWTDQAMKSLKTLTTTSEPVGLDSTSPKEDPPKATAQELKSEDSTTQTCKKLKVVGPSP